MHEYALCQTLVAAVLEAYGEVAPAPRSLRAARVAVGAMHQVIPEYFEEAYGLLVKETPLAGSRLELRAIPVTALCEACGWEGAVELPFICCGGCGAHGVTVKSGKELYLEGLEVVADD